MKTSKSFGKYSGIVITGFFLTIFTFMAFSCCKKNNSIHYFFYRTYIYPPPPDTLMVSNIFKDFPANSLQLANAKEALGNLYAHGHIVPPPPPDTLAIAPKTCQQIADIMVVYRIQGNAKGTEKIFLKDKDNKIVDSVAIVEKKVIADYTLFKAEIPAGLIQKYSALNVSFKFTNRDRSTEDEFRIQVK